jgi:hypothetical protein
LAEDSLPASADARANDSEAAAGGRSGIAGYTRPGATGTGAKHTEGKAGSSRSSAANAYSGGTGSRTAHAIDCACGSTFVATDTRGTIAGAIRRSTDAIDRRRRQPSSWCCWLSR